MATNIVGVDDVDVATVFLEERLHDHLAALRDFAVLFPDQMLKLNPEVRKIIAIWEEIVRWEKSSYFGLPPFLITAKQEARFKRQPDASD